jgi:3-hydroxyacyl-CoA dehydrogenase
MDRIRKTCDDAVARGRVSADEAAARIARVTPALQLDTVASCDLVIEAVFEDLALKSRLAADLGAVCKQQTLLASNTSSLDIDALARASGRADRYLGVHFFSPAHIMRLVEVVRGAQTSAATIDAVVALIGAMGKIPIVCGVCFGFIGNRMAEPYLREAEALMLEGVSPATIDAVAQDPDMLGMAMGPCRMMDLAGLDICASMIAERAATTNLLDDSSYRCVVRALTERGHFGQKTGRGIYRYEGRQPVEDPQTGELVTQLAVRHGVRRRDVSRQEILERLFYPLINEGFEVLRDGIAANSTDIDTVFTAGYGFPAARGGPMAMADAIGAGTILSRLADFARERGNTFNYWTPSPLLVERARSEEHS